LSAIEWIGFDADDTLWHTERMYVDVQQRFAQLLADYHDPDWINERLYQTESRNMQHYGYGIKAFTLSLIETALELTEGRVSAGEIQVIVGWAKEMINANVELLPHVSQVVPQLARRYPLMLITKGDILDQESKIERSGLVACFQQVEIVSEKTPERYVQLLQRHGIAPQRFLMVGNSLRSDVLPVLHIGASAVHVPYELTWQHEAADQPPADQPGFYAIAHLGELPALLQRIDS